MDVRGVGASDKPPIGYDAPTRTRDIAGVIRSLGSGRAVVVGHGTGGSLAWAMAALQPAVTAGVAAFSAPHPARLHTSARRLLTPAARRQLAFYQVPTLPERALVRGDLVADVLATGAAQPFAPDVVDTYRTVMRIPFAAHTAMESLRWAVRSTPRPDGRRFLAALRHPVEVPALQVHAAQDGLLRRDLADADGAALARDFRFEVVDDAGHFLPEEAPDTVTELLLDWLPRRSGPRADRAAAGRSAGDRQLVLTSAAALTGSTSPTPNDGHHRAIVHAPHAGLRAKQTRRPWKISRWESMVHSDFSIRPPTTCSTLTGSSSVVHPRRRTRRPKCVSTVSPGTPNAFPSTTFAVLRPTPGRETRSSRRAGTSPSNRSTSAWPIPMTDWALARKKPVGRRISSSSARSADAYAAASGYRAKSAGVVRFTRLSVVWAERTVATSSSSGVVKSSSQCASGWVIASSRFVRRARRTSARCDSGFVACARACSVVVTNPP